MGFFADPDSDAQLEADNAVFWEALLAFVEDDFSASLDLSVVDVGCHRGGLLERIARRWPGASLIGVEPSEDARRIAGQRLARLAKNVTLLTPDAWSDVRSESVDLITCHEVLYLVEDLPFLLESFRRTLRKGGVAYVVFGCHTENQVWSSWRKTLRAEGVETFDYAPMDVIGLATAARLAVSARPLRRDGWIRYDPHRATFRFDSVAQLFDHHYRHKLLLRMVRR